MSYIGNGLTDIQVNRYEYTATSGQTVFNCTYDRAVDVYLNGVRLAESDFTATTGTSITLATGATAGDIVTIAAYYDITNGDIDAVAPAQSGNAGKFLTTDGTNASWGSTLYESGGNIGIGTDSPSTKLQVVDSGNVAIKVTKSSVSSISLDVGTTENAIIWDGSRDLKFMGGSSGTAERMRINSNGNVGIGTSSPAHKLEVSGDVKFGPNGTTNEYQGLVLQNGKDSSAATSTSFVDFRNNLGVPDAHLFARRETDGSSSLAFGTTPAGSRSADRRIERMRIDSAGNLKFNSGYGSVATAYGCRAWVNFNGTGTVAIRASGNVSSITDKGVGKYRANFTTAMPDANYAFTMQQGTNVTTSASLTHAVQKYGTTYMDLYTYTGGNDSLDNGDVTAAVFR